MNEKELRFVPAIPSNTNRDHFFHGMKIMKHFADFFPRRDLGRKNINPWAFKPIFVPGHMQPKAHIFFEQPYQFIGDRSKGPVINIFTSHANAV